MGRTAVIYIGGTFGSMMPLYSVETEGPSHYIKYRCRCVKCGVETDRLQTHLTRPCKACHMIARGTFKGLSGSPETSQRPLPLKVVPALPVACPCPTEIPVAPQQADSLPEANQAPEAVLPNPPVLPSGIPSLEDLF